MVICNRELIKTIESDDLDEPISEFDTVQCQNLNPNADLLDFRTEMDQRSFYERSDFNPCRDLWMISDEECLWQAIVGEIKTPYRALANSIGQLNYGCEIWSLMGQNVDHLLVKEFEHYIIQTCLKYPEVNNVTNINTKIGEESGSFLCEITIDSIYGVFNGVTRIPNAKPTRKRWIPTDTMFVS